MKSAIYCPDEYIVRQGTTPKGLFLITRGVVHVLKGPPTEPDEDTEGDASPDKASCRVSFESGRSSPGPSARPGAKQVRKSLVGAPGALLGAMGKGQKRQSLVRQGTFSRLSCRGSVGPIKGRSSKAEGDGEETGPPELTVLQQLTDNEFFGEDSLVSHRAGSHTPCCTPYYTSRYTPLLHSPATPLTTPLTWWMGMSLSKEPSRRSTRDSAPFRSGCAQGGGSRARGREVRFACGSPRG